MQRYFQVKSDKQDLVDNVPQDWYKQLETALYARRRVFTKTELQQWHKQKKWHPTPTLSTLKKAQYKICNQSNGAIKKLRQ